MKFSSWLNEKTKKMDWIDMALTKIGSMTFGILLVFLIPQILQINVLWIVAIWIIFVIRPMYRFFK